MDFRKILRYFVTCIKWLVLAVVVGALVGPCAGAFGVALRWANDTRTGYPWLIFFLPLGGVVIVWLYQAAHNRDGGSTNAVFTAVQDKVLMPLSTAPLIFISTVLTHLLGGSAGREGAALQLGGAISGQLGRRLKMDADDCRVMTMCGMSAAFAALFGTPLAATVFTLEVVSVGTMYYASLVPCMLSALMGVGVANLIGLEPTSFLVEAILPVTVQSVLQVVALAALTGVLSIAFCQLLHVAPKLYARFIPNAYLRAAVGGVLVVALTLAVKNMDYNGAGEHVIHAAVAGSAVPWAFLLKMLFTALTLGAGFKGGEIVPLFFTGATFGCAVAPLLGLPAYFGAAVGLVTMFCGATNTPLASIFLAAEIFRGRNLTLFALACAVSYVCSGYFSLYSKQQFVFSKLTAELRKDDVE